MNMIRLLQIGRVAVVTSGILLTGGAGYSAVLYLTTASHFEVKKFSVSGLKHMDENQLLAKAGFEAGTNVFRVDLRAIRERVEQLPWVRHAMVERVFPDQIIIKVIEREPIGLARIQGEITSWTSTEKFSIRIRPVVGPAVGPGVRTFRFWMASVSAISRQT